MYLDIWHLYGTYIVHSMHENVHMHLLAHARARVHVYTELRNCTHEHVHVHDQVYVHAVHTHNFVYRNTYLYCYTCILVALHTRISKVWSTSATIRPFARCMDVYVDHLSFLYIQSPSITMCTSNLVSKMFLVKFFHTFIHSVAIVGAKHMAFMHIRIHITKKFTFP